MCRIAEAARWTYIVTSIKEFIKRPYSCEKTSDTLLKKLLKVLITL